jgi:hypothetical protein
MALWSPSGYKILYHRGHGVTQGKPAAFLILGDGGDGTFGADEDGATGGVGADGVELNAGLFGWADAGGVLGRMEVEYEFGVGEEQADVSLVILFILGGECSEFAVVRDSGEVGLREDFGESPGLAAVGGGGEVRAIVVGMFVVSAGDDAVVCVAKGDREDSGGIGSVGNGGAEDLPGASAVSGVEDTGRFAAGGEPDVEIARNCEDGEASVAGGESAFAFECGWQLRRWNGSPVLAIVGDHQVEFQFAGLVGDGITQNNAVGGVPEGDGVEESLGIGVGELELPMLASVRGVVDARLVAGACGHQESFVGREGDDSTEIQSGCVGNLGGGPGASAVGGADISAVRTGGPNDLLRNGADAAQSLRGIGRLSLAGELGEGGGGSEEDEQGSHAGIVSEKLRSGGCDFLKKLGAARG